MDRDALLAIAPVVLLLGLGVPAALASRALRTSPIIGYLFLGVVAHASRLRLAGDSGAIAVLSDLGVMFLLFDIGLHFSLARIRAQARDIFAFGTVQVLFAGSALGAALLLVGLPAPAAFLLGFVLALSSTAVVVRLISDRAQQNCPVALTATAILIFQDVAGIFLLIIAGSLGSGVGVLPAAALALAKAVALFSFAILLSKVVVRPLFDLVARSGSEEVFTAMALTIALAAGWVAGGLGLSLTLGAFLGGMMLSETPYRPVIPAEVKPFKGLLVGFFFIAVGASIDLDVLRQAWAEVIAPTTGVLVLKTLSNISASLVFNWSIPGSVQLGFLLAQGSEFAFVVLSLPSVRALLGPSLASVSLVAVAISLALTPALAAIGRMVAGNLRRRAPLSRSSELQAASKDAPLLIVGMGRRGRTVADALKAFDLGYSAVERDPDRLKRAVADGYETVFGDMSDPRLWSDVALSTRRIGVLTAPVFEVSSELNAYATTTAPSLTRLAAVDDEEQAARFRMAGIAAVVDHELPCGLRLAAEMLAQLGVETAEITAWCAKQAAGVEPTSREALAPA